MKVLIIDNGTIRLKELKKLLDQHDVKVIPHYNLKVEDPDNYDLLVLTGSSLYPIWGHEKHYSDEILLIKQTQVPILGICLGFELICYAHGAELERIDNKVEGLNEIKFNKDYDYFSDLPNFFVYESHKWVITELPSDLENIAFSTTGIEIMKHKDKNIWGFQFHPEMFVEKACGDEIFKSVLNIL